MQSADLRHPCRDALGRNRAVVLLGEVDRVAQERLDLHQRLAQRREPPRETALELLQRGAGLGRRHGVDEIAHGLRLHQVELAVQHRAAGELARRGGTRARGMERGEQPRGREQAAVAGELDEVVAGVAVRPGKDGVEPTIDRRARRVAEGGEQRDPRPVAAEPLHHLRRHVEGPRPLSRTTASAARPGGVARAAMGSESMGGRYRGGSGLGEGRLRGHGPGGRGGTLRSSAGPPIGRTATSSSASPPAAPPAWCSPPASRSAAPAPARASTAAGCWRCCSPRSRG